MSQQLHEHQAGDASAPHHQDHSTQSLRRMLWALLITAGFALAEVVGGWWSGSLALLSDAGHMFTDVAALGLALGAQWLGRRPANQGWSFGLARAEVLAAFINGLAMLLLIVWIVWEAVQRLRQPEAVAGGWVIGIALVGLCCNLWVYRLLSSEHSAASAPTHLNRRAALLHVLGDLFGSVAALLAGLIIYLTGWLAVDPLLSMVICGLLLRSTLSVLRESAGILLEAVPSDISFAAVGLALETIPGVVSVHDLHIWNMAAGRPALIAHLRIQAQADWHAVLSSARMVLRERFAIEHITLQPEILTEGA